jgi:hypothetical protein
VSDEPGRRARRPAPSLVLAVVALNLVGAVALILALTRGSDARATAPVRIPAAQHAPTSIGLPRPIGAATTLKSTPPARLPARPPHRAAKVATPPPPRPVPLPLSSLPDIAAALRVVQASEVDGVTVGFAVYGSNGQMLGAENATSENYGGSITKSMLLVAYLRQTGNGELSSEARGELESMIEVSDNDAADWVYAHLASPDSAVLDVASSVGMTGFELDTSDPVYVLGQSHVTANDLARLFADIGSLMPAAQRSFGMGLLSHLASADQVGLLQAGLPGVVYSKEGWKPEPDGLEGAPYIVNQAGQFSKDGNTYGIAFTVAGVSDKPSAEAIIQRITSALT